MRVSQKDYYDSKYNRQIDDTVIFRNRWILERGMDFPGIKRLFGELELDNARLLDIGCGDQPTSYVLAPQSKSNIIGLDTSSPGLHVAKQREQTLMYPGFFHPLVGDALNLPFKDASFDIVLWNRCLEHTPDPAKALAEGIRVLKDGGRIFLLTLNKNYFLRRCYQLFNRSHWSSEDYPRKPFLDFHQIDAWLTENNARIEKRLFPFNLVSACWDLSLLPKWARHTHLKPDAGETGRTGILGFTRSIIRKLDFIDWLLKKGGQSSVIVIIARKSPETGKNKK